MHQQQFRSLPGSYGTTELDKAQPPSSSSVPGRGEKIHQDLHLRKGEIDHLCEGTFELHLGLWVGIKYRRVVGGLKGTPKQRCHGKVQLIWGSDKFQFIGPHSSSCG